jgi:hypothetical protein
MKHERQAPCGASAGCQPGWATERGEQMRRFCLGNNVAARLRGVRGAVGSRALGGSRPYAFRTGIEQEPRSNRQVAFVVTAGPNMGDTGDDCTDEAGQAHFTYTGDGGPGTDTMTATVTGSCGDLATVSSLGGQGAFDTPTKTWVAASPLPPPAAPRAAPPSPPPAGGVAPSGALPFTGFPVWIVLLAAAGLIGAGAWLLPRTREDAVGRRTRTASKRGGVTPPR